MMLAELIHMQSLASAIERHHRMTDRRRDANPVPFSAIVLAGSTRLNDLINQADPPSADQPRNDLRYLSFQASIGVSVWPPMAADLADQFATSYADLSYSAFQDFCETWCLTNPHIRWESPGADARFRSTENQAV